MHAWAFFSVRACVHSTAHPTRAHPAHYVLLAILMCYHEYPYDGLKTESISTRVHVHPCNLQDGTSKDRRRSA